MKILYSLGENIKLRKEKIGGVIFVESDEDALFFYVPKNFNLFLKMKDKNISLAIDSNNINSNIMNFLSYMIKNQLFVLEKKEDRKYLETKNMPELINLFITPTVHFRRYYSYGK